MTSPTPENTTVRWWRPALTACLTGSPAPFPYSQRWGYRQHSWRHPADGGFHAPDFEVVRLPEHLARGFVTRHHYAASFPAARFSYALTTTDDRLAIDGATVAGRALVGVAVLSVPMRAAVLTNVFPDLEPNAQALELGRLVLTDTPANAESWFLRRVFEHAATEGIRGIVSFSDPMPRTRTTVDPDGHDRTEQFMPGHVGICYQATNALALGRSTRRTLTYLPRHGLVLSDRTLQKVRAQEAGADAAERRIVALGARPRRAAETPARWLRDALDELHVTKVRHPGNYRYAWPLGRPAERRRTRIGLPRTAYPKPDRASLPLF
ncbi:hypothetical protein ACPPVW_18500 [Leifsonia sp. McL0607]|uniref:Mom family adenine methylcarbamoylation protein n=1 Tax=Leifsonia sp. McL0607 TaxID=3415672 RepID=UPI003CF81436